MVRLFKPVPTQQKCSALPDVSPGLSKVSYFYKSVVGRNIALHAVPALQGFYLPSFCLPGSFNFVFSNCSFNFVFSKCLHSRPDMTFAVDWAFVQNQSYIYVFNPQRWNAYYYDSDDR